MKIVSHHRVDCFNYKNEYCKVYTDSGEEITNLSYVNIEYTTNGQPEVTIKIIPKTLILEDNKEETPEELKLENMGISEVPI